MRPVPLAILSILVPFSAHAKLGETEAQSVERYGAPYSAKRLSSGPNGSIEKRFFKNEWHITPTFVAANDGTLKVIKEVVSPANRRPISYRDFAAWAAHERPTVRWYSAVKDRQWTATDGTIAGLSDDQKSLRFELPLVHINNGTLAKVPDTSGEQAKKKPNWVPGLVGLAVFFGIVNGLKSQARKSRGSRKTEPLPEPAGSTAPTPPPTPKPLAPRRTLAGLSWEELELLTGELYRRKGYQVELSAGTGSDGGIDLVLHKEGAKSLVQCKHYSSQKVPVNAVREFYGTLMHEGVTHGIFVTTGEFSRDAKDFADGKPIELIDGSILALMVENWKASPEEDLLNVAQWAPAFYFQAKLTTPDCPFCKVPMVLRSSAKPFWGCRTYPKCKGKRDLRQHSTGAMARL